MYDLGNLAVIDLIDRRQAAYNADMTWVLAQMFAGFAGNKNFDVHAPSRHLQEDNERFIAHEDDRSGKQIVQAVYDKLKKIAKKGG